MKLKSEPGGGLSGFLDRDSEFTGELNFKETLRIDGKFQGTIRTGKSLVVGETAEIDADIEVGSLFVSGRLQGKVRATERVELHSTARVQAELDTTILVVEEGALFEGNCSMKGLSKKRASDEEAAVAQTPTTGPTQIEKQQVFRVK